MVIKVFQKYIFYTMHIMQFDHNLPHVIFPILQ